MELNLQPPSPAVNRGSKGAKGIRLDPRRRALVAQGLFGIYNMGSTCFMSCILQVLLHTPLLRAFFLGGGHMRSFCKSVEKQLLKLKRSILIEFGSQKYADEIVGLHGGEEFSCMACEFDELFMDWYGKESWDLTENDILPRAPYSFLSTTWKVSETLAGYKQQDAHEFFIAVLDNLRVHLERHEQMRKRIKILALFLAEHEAEQRKLNQKLVKNHKLGSRKGSVDSLSGNTTHHQKPDIGSEVVRQQCHIAGGGEGDRAVGNNGASQEGVCYSVNQLLSSQTLTPRILNALGLSNEDIVSFPTSHKLQGGEITTEGWEHTSTSMAISSSCNLRDLSLSDIVSELFAGVTKSAVVCCKCGMASCTYERFLDVSLSICKHDEYVPEGSSPKKGKSNNCNSKCPNGQREAEREELSSCFQRFTTVEKLGSSMSCDGCGEKSVSKTRELSFCHLPAVLTLQLKRFHTNGMQKLDDHVQFPLYSLNMGNFMSSPCYYNGKKNDTLPHPILYDLLGVVSHKGNNGSGHYITYIREMGGWCKCDDMVVQWVDEEEVRNAEAYMLVYVAVADR
eukprot:515288_1